MSERFPTIDEHTHPDWFNMSGNVFHDWQKAETPEERAFLADALEFLK